MADAKRRYRQNLQSEIDGATVYEAMAEAEADPKLAEVYRRLAKVERAHAEFWAKRLDAEGKAVRPSPRARLLAFLSRRFGAAFVLPTLAEAEARDSGGYDDQPEAAAQGMPADERSHARVLQAAVSAGQGLSGPVVGRLEGRHRGGGGNALRAAVLGANDGLVSNLSLVMGVAGAAVQGRALLLTGLAGLVAGAGSMAMGEWLSVSSARELAQRQIDAEAQELAEAPEMEQEELALIYQSKGLDEAAARALAARLFENREAALDTLVREELGVDPDELGGSAWTAAGASAALFAAGAFVPVAPFLFLTGAPAIIASAAASGAALALIGISTGLFTGRGLVFSAARQLAIGYAAAALTYGLGRLAELLIR